MVPSEEFVGISLGSLYREGDILDVRSTVRDQNMRVGDAAVADG
jgi:hypothetical protein